VIAQNLEDIPKHSSYINLITNFGSLRRFFRNFDVRYLFSRFTTKTTQLITYNNVGIYLQETSKKIRMGFNISGLAINKNYENQFDELQKELGWNLEKQSEIDFETASSNWTEDGICDVYFTEKGTLIFISMDMCAESWSLKNDNTLTFALSETSMAFNINYSENGVEKRSIMEVNDERMQDEGKKLGVEDISEDTSEIIWNQLELVIGKRFWDIEPNEKAVRYIFGKDLEQKTQVKAQPKKKEIMLEAKKWWQFWK
jgi:hypothetical protein